MEITWVYGIPFLYEEQSLIPQPNQIHNLFYDTSLKIRIYLVIGKIKLNCKCRKRCLSTNSSLQQSILFDHFAVYFNANFSNSSNASTNISIYVFSAIDSASIVSTLSFKQQQMVYPTFLSTIPNFKFYANSIKSPINTITT